MRTGNPIWRPEPPDAPAHPGASVSRRCGVGAWSVRRMCAPGVHAPVDERQDMRQCLVCGDMPLQYISLKGDNTIMGAMHGKRPLPLPAQKGHFTLSNGMYCVYGQMADEGLCVDVYRDKSMKELVSMQHGVELMGDMTEQQKVNMLRSLMESMLDEF